MEAIILAGGFGTRLKKVISDVPKPMAPINNIPFLEYIFNWLKLYNITHVVLAVGYKKEIIINHFKDNYRNIKIEYSIEDKPLLTGGAIKKALKKCRENNVFIINGDTFFDINLNELKKQHEEKQAELSIAIKEMKYFDRYGSVLIDKNNKIIGFTEKKYHQEGYINGGVYCIRKNTLAKLKKEVFSFEKEYMEKYVDKDKMIGLASQGYFIDIGIPEDYLKAQEHFIK